MAGIVTLIVIVAGAVAVAVAVAVAAVLASWREKFLVETYKRGVARHLYGRRWLV